MHVLHVITSINRGGAENHLRALISEQRRGRHEVTCVYQKGDGYWSIDLERIGCKVHCLRGTHYGDIRAWLRLRRLIKLTKPDLVHAHLEPAELYAATSLIGLAVPLVISKHNELPLPTLLPLRALLRFAARRADATIAISHSVSRYYQRALALAGEREPVVVHYGIDTNEYMSVDRSAARGIREGWGGASNEVIYGCIARLVPQKALHVLIRAYATCRRRRPDMQSRLVIVGEGPLLNHLQQLCRDMNIASEVVFAGYQTDIPAIISAMDVFTLSSDFEGFGLAILEAMAAGKPVIATSVSSIPEIVVDGETGLTTPPGDEQAFADAIERLYADAVLREEMGLRGQQRARTKFKLSDVYEKTHNVYVRATAEGVLRDSAV